MIVYYMCKCMFVYQLEWDRDGGGGRSESVYVW